MTIYNLFPFVVILIIQFSSGSTSFLDPISSGIDSFRWKKYSPMAIIVNETNDQGSWLTFSRKREVEYSLMEGSCSSKLYCQGKLLDTIQRSGIFKDSKTFVDMPTKRPEMEVIVI